MVTKLSFFPVEAASFFLFVRFLFFLINSPSFCRPKCSTRCSLDLFTVLYFGFLFSILTVLFLYCYIQYLCFFYVGSFVIAIYFNVFDFFCFSLVWLSFHGVAHSCIYFLFSLTLSFLFHFIVKIRAIYQGLDHLLFLGLHTFLFCNIFSFNFHFIPLSFPLFFYFIYFLLFLTGSLFMSCSPSCVLLLFRFVHHCLSAFFGPFPCVLHLQITCLALRCSSFFILDLIL